MELRWIALALALCGCGEAAMGGATDGDETDAGARDPESPDLLVEIDGTLYAGHSQTLALTPLPLPSADAEDSLYGCTPHGHAILRTFTVGDETELRMVDLDTMTETVLPVPHDFQFPRIFPDRSAIAGGVADDTFVGGYTTRNVAVIDTKTGAELWRTQTPEIIETVMGVSPDGQWLAVAYSVLSGPPIVGVIETGLRVFPSTGGDDLEFSVIGDTPGVADVQWLSDSRRLLVAHGQQVELLDLEARSESTIAAGGGLRLTRDETRLALEVRQPDVGLLDSGDIELWLSDPWRQASRPLDARPGDSYEVRGWSSDSASLLAALAPDYDEDHAPPRWHLVDADGTNDREIFDETPYGRPTYVQWCDVSAAAP